jgi:hypothetical protein
VSETGSCSATADSAEDDRPGFLLDKPTGPLGPGRVVRRGKPGLGPAERRNRASLKNPTLGE